MATTYTLNAVNSKAGSIVLTPSNSPSNTAMPDYMLNIKSAKVVGNNPFLADGVTDNPNATVSLLTLSCGSQGYFFKDIAIKLFTQIGGTTAPTTLSGVMLAIANLVAE